MKVEDLINEVQAAQIWRNRATGAEVKIYANTEGRVFFRRKSQLGTWGIYTKSFKIESFVRNYEPTFEI